MSNIELESNLKDVREQTKKLCESLFKLHKAGVEVTLVAQSTSRLNGKLSSPAMVRVASIKIPAMLFRLDKHSIE